MRDIVARREMCRNILDNLKILSDIVLDVLLESGLLFTKKECNAYFKLYGYTTHKR